MKKARKLSEVQQERAAREAEQQAKQRARETRERVKRVVAGADEIGPISREYTSTINGQRPLCYTDPVGPSRFTAQRFLSDCCTETRDLLRNHWLRGDQLIARRVPVDGLPCVVIMSSFLRQFDVELVDDFDALIERYADHVKEVAHPDKFLASCIHILHGRFQQPEPEAFETVGIPAIYEELF